MAPIDFNLLLLILKQICLGSLISGLIIFFLTLFLQGSHLFHYGADLDHDIDHDVSLDHGVALDKDFSLDDIARALPGGGVIIFEDLGEQSINVK